MTVHLSMPSVVYPMQPVQADAVARYARGAIAAGARRLWLGQSVGVESHQTLAYLAGMGIRVPVGLGVTLMPLRHPYEAALQARSLALLTGHPVVAGYGAATPDFVAALHGAAYERPARAAAAYATAVRDCLTSRPDGGPNLTTLPPVPHPEVELGLGVLRPAMARAAGAVADVAITWLTPADYVRDVLAPELSRHGKHRRKPPRIATFVHVAIARPGRDPRRLALVGSGAHLSTPHYTAMLRRAGVPADPSDPVRGAAALVAARVFAYGTAAEIAAVVRGYRDAGVDEVVLNPAGVAGAEGDRAALADLTEILAAVADTGTAADSTTDKEKT